MVREDAVGHPCVYECPTLQQSGTDGGRGDVIQDAGSTEVGRTRDNVEDRIAVKLHYVDENALVTDGVFGGERHTKAFRSSLDSLEGVATCGEVSQDAEVSACASSGLAWWMNLNSLSTEGWKKDL